MAGTSTKLRTMAAYGERQVAQKPPEIPISARIQYGATVRFGQLASPMATHVSPTPNPLQLYGRMAQLKIQIAWVDMQISNKKKKMGINIFEAMQASDHRGAEVKTRVSPRGCFYVGPLLSQASPRGHTSTLRIWPQRHHAFGFHLTPSPNFNAARISSWSASGPSTS